MKACGVGGRMCCTHHWLLLPPKLAPDAVLPLISAFMWPATEIAKLSGWKARSQLRDVETARTGPSEAHPK
jgi:hypothetical protein